MKRSGKRRGSAVLIRFMLMIMIMSMGLFAGSFFRTIPAFAAEPGDLGQEVWTQDAGSTALDLSEIENYLDRIGEQKTAGMTFGELMNMIRQGTWRKSFCMEETGSPPCYFRKSGQTHHFSRRS